MDASITAAELRQSLRGSTPPLESPYLIKGALRRNPENRLDLAPEAAGLLAADDLAVLAQGMVVYDALYAACR